MGVTRPGRFPSVARSADDENPEFQGKTGKNSSLSIACRLRRSRFCYVFHDSIPVSRSVCLTSKAEWRVKMLCWIVSSEPGRHQTLA